MSVSCEENGCAFNSHGFCRSRRVRVGDGAMPSSPGCLCYRTRLTDAEAGAPLSAGGVECAVTDCAYHADRFCTRDTPPEFRRRAVGNGDVPPCASFSAK